MLNSLFEWKKSKGFWLSSGILFFTIWYIAICVLHYLGQRPLWLDENMVFESVKTFSPLEFFHRKLAYDQIFPKCYLFLIQRIAEPFGLQILSLRFLSCVAMLSGFAIWMNIAGQSFSDRSHLLTYVLSWAGSSLMVYYSAELKPYSMDVLTSGLFMLYLSRADGWLIRKRSFYLTGMIILPLLGLLSYPAFLFYVFLFLHLFAAKEKDGFWRLNMFFFFAAAIFAIGFVYWVDIRVAKANTGTQGFSDHIVSLASVGEFFKTWWEGTLDLFCRFFADRPRIFKRISILFGMSAFGMMLYSFIKEFPKQGWRFRSFRTVAIVLYGELWVLGILHKYPFAVARTVLFFCPIVLLLIVDFIKMLKNHHRSSGLVFEWVYRIFLCVIAAGIAREALSGNLGFSPVIW